MSDNTQLSAAVGTGDVIASDDISGVKYQRVKVVLGADGVNSGDVSTANPLPVSDASGSLTVDNAGTFAVQATVAAGATNIAKAEDVASADADVGVPAMAVRKATPANTSGTDGDYEMLQMSAGRLWASATIDAALPAGTNAIGKLASNDGVDVGDVTINNASGASAVNVQDGGNSLTVDAPVGTPVFVRLSDGAAAISALPVTDNSGSLTVDNAGTFAVQATVAASATNIAKAEDVASADADVGVPAMAVRKATPANTSGTDGDYEMLQMSAGRLWVDASGVTLTVGSHAVTNAGTFAVQAASAGDVAHDAADSGNPVKTGGKATTSQSGLTLVADADRTDARYGIDGFVLNRPHTNLESIVTGNASNTDGTSTQCIAAQTSGIKTYLTSIILTNTSASMIYVEIKDGTTVKLTIPVPATGGAIFNPPVPLPGTAATAWNFDPSAATTTVYCSMIGFTSKV